MLLLATAAFVAAFRTFDRGWRRTSVLVLIGAGGLIRFYSGSVLGLHAWDERYHALVAKHLMREPLFVFDSRDWHANHVWLHKPPLALWMMAGSMSVLGVNEFAVRLPGLLWSTLSIWLTFDIGRMLFGSRVGVTAAFLHAVNPMLVLLATGRMATDHVDTIFVGIVELGVWLSVVHAAQPRAWLLVFLGIATGAGLLTKWLPALLIPGLHALLRMRGGPARASAEAVTIALTGSVIALPWELHIRSRFPQEAAHERAYNWAHLFAPVEGHGGSPFFHLIQIPPHFGELAWIPIAWFVILAMRLCRARGLLERPAHGVVVAWWAVPYLVFSLVATKMKGYVAPAAPAIFLMQAYVWWYLRLTLARRPARWFFQTVLALLLLLPAKQIAAQVNPFRAAHRDPAWRREILALRGSGDPERTVIFNSHRPIETMFYTGITTYPYPLIPSAEQIAHLETSGYRVVILKQR